MDTCGSNKSQKSYESTQHGWNLCFHMPQPVTTAGWTLTQTESNK